MSEIPHLSTAEPEGFGGLNIELMANLRTKYPTLAEIVTVPCHVCKKTEIQCMRYFASLTACDECRNAAIEQYRLKMIRKYWESICPSRHQQASINAPWLPAVAKTVYRENRSYKGEKSLFLYGPSGTGKTSAAVMLCKLALLEKKHVKFLWPEELKSFAKDNFARLQHIQSYGKADVLFMDDALLTGAQDERIADFLKDLIDYSQRHGGKIIITSQIGGADYEDQGDKFGNMTKTDHERIIALLRRIREDFTVLPFVVPAAAEAKEEAMF
jgi:DNA replication protein DnaC